LSRAAYLAGCAVVIVTQLWGCGLSDDAERNRVLTELDRLRDMPANHPKEMLAAAEALAALPVENEKTREARDTCAKAHIDRAKMHMLIQELEAEVKAPVLKTDPKVLADKYRTIEELEKSLASQLEACSVRYTQLLTAK